MSTDADISRLAEHLDRARSVVVLTGAGVSAESGIPTFRDALTGLWARYDPTELATPEAFAADPATVTRWYDERRQSVARCEQNPAHEALANLERALVDRDASFLLVTQNVDRLHHRAGSERLVELHGTLCVWRCTKTGREFEDLPMPFEEYPPKSADGGLLRPGVVWFGEQLPHGAMERAEDATMACDLFISIGTSAVVYPAAGLISTAARAGATTVEITLEPTPASGAVDISILGKAGEIMPRVVGAMGGG